MRSLDLGEYDHPEYERFYWEAQRRMAKGVDSYGDASFFAPPLELIREIKEELLDTANWSFLLYQRMCRIEAKIVSVLAETSGHAKG